MMKNSKKVMPLGYLLGALVMSSELSAATINWVSATQAVPLSTTSLMILAALFMIVGAWLLPKSKGYAQKISLIAILVLGTYGFTDKVFAATGDIEIPSSSGNKQLNEPGTSTVVNKIDTAVRIVSITDLSGGCVVDNDTCTGNTLNKDESCNVSISCSSSDYPD